MSNRLDHSLASFSALTDPRIGIINSVEIVRLSEKDPRVFLAYATPADTLPLMGIRAANKGAACATSADRAVLRACGESLERYCSACYDESSLKLATSVDLEAGGARCILPAELYPFTSEQYGEDGFPFEPANSNTPLHWCEATGFDGTRVFIPASCTYVPYRFRDGVEPFTHMPISTGLAAGRDIAFCIEKGVCEILERDALMIGWAHRRSPPRIESSRIWQLSPQLMALHSAVPLGTQLRLVYLSLDIPVPIIGAALIDSGEPALTSFGISADIDPLAALAGAIEEAMLTRLLVNRMKPEVIDLNNIRTLHDHLKAHAFGKWSRDAMSFLLEEGPLWGWQEVLAASAKSSSALAAVRELGHDGAWIEVTTPDVAEYGFRVVRTVMPRFQPLDNDHKCRYLGGLRLSEVPVSLGMPRRTVSQYNTDPHPFP